MKYKVGQVFKNIQDTNWSLGTNQIVKARSTNVLAGDIAVIAQASNVGRIVLFFPRIDRWGYFPSGTIESEFEFSLYETFKHLIEENKKCKE